MDRHAQRRDQLLHVMRSRTLDALLVTNARNVTYLTGFSGDDSLLFVSRDKIVIISDMRFTEQIEEECPGLEAAIRKPGTRLEEFTSNVIKTARVSTLAVEASSMTLAAFEQLRGFLPQATLKPEVGLVETLREIKDAGEIADLREAIRIAEKAMAVIKASLRREQTEKQIADDLEHQMRLFGGEAASFPPIIAAGPRAALPHARPGPAVIGDSSLLLVDWGAQARLYRSDLTRVFALDKISPKLERVYGVVLTAQERAIAAIRPGATCEEVDAAARGYITEQGFGKQFGHGLGHGIGLDIHENPRMGLNQKQPLKAGMVVTVEPGVYLRGWGGVRIEDDVLVTKTGHEVLSHFPKQLEQLAL